MSSPSSRDSSQPPWQASDAPTEHTAPASAEHATGADVSAADAASLDVFSDTEDVSGWAVQTMAWAVEAGVIEGVEGSVKSRGRTGPATRLRIRQARSYVDKLNSLSNN